MLLRVEVSTKENFLYGDQKKRLNQALFAAAAEWAETYNLELIRVQVVANPKGGAKR